MKGICVHSMFQLILIEKFAVILHITAQTLQVMPLVLIINLLE